MPQVTYLGPTSPADGTEEVHVDDVVLVKDGEPQSLTDAQLRRVKELRGHRFDVDGSEQATTVLDAPRFASPEAEELAGEYGLELSEITGTGADGAVTADDVREAAE